MHIKTLEIVGFKSFVDRTVVHFDHDVIGIVGPNGCGKSNIVDAVRWCMGEQSARHLRGKSMEDVIFNGSDSRGPHGMAEVTITFDNSEPAQSHGLPVEYRDLAEIAVSRRLFRDGTSEYLINRAQVRLRDVTDLFLGTGVGTKAYSIIEQGRVGQIVSARPEDRRLFIEEAAGVTKYKQRRRQTERKLELTRQNLLRISDIFSEVERNRNSLRRQVAKAERYLRYRGELEDLELHAASHQFLEHVVLGQVESTALESARELVERARAELGDADAALAAAKQEALSIEDRADAASQAAFVADQEVSSLHAQATRARDRIETLGLREQSDQRELRLLQEQAAQLAAEQADLSSEVETLEAEEHRRETDTASENDTLSQLRVEEARANAQVQALHDRSAALAAQAAALEARLMAAEERIVESRTRRDRLSNELEELQGEIANLTGLEAGLVRTVGELAEGKRLTDDERKCLEQEMHGLRMRLVDSESAVDAAKNELVHKRNRLRALSDLHRRLEGVDAGVRALLSRDDTTVLGLFADRIEVPEPLTAALTGLLGNRLQYVIVSDPVRGVELLDELRAAERGRAHVVPARPFYVSGAARRAPAGEGVIGLLTDHLKYEPRDEALIRALVGDAIVVEQASHALDVVAHHPGTTAVALDGTVVRPNGVVSGGSGDDVASAMVEQKREIRLLTQEVERLSAEESRLVSAHQALRSRMTEVGTSLDRAREGAHEGELAHARAEKDLTRARSDLERATHRVTSIGLEIDEIDQSLVATAAADDEARQELDGARSQADHTTHELERAEALAADWKQRAEGQASLVAERRIRLAQIREQLESKRAMRQRIVRSIEDKRTRADRLDQELEQTAAAFGETAAQLLLLAEAREVAEQTADQAHGNHHDAEQLRDQIRNALGVREEAIRALRVQLEEQEEAKHHHEMAVQKIQSDHQHLLEDVRRRFRGLNLARIIGDYHARPCPNEEHHRRIRELTQLIDRMGPVNLDAQAEYESAHQRYVTLGQQKEDLEQALANLDKAIKHINRESKRRFRETFYAVNELFKETFTRLFRGGRAELRLTNPDDMLESGVDIAAQPPGKRLANIELMSGGEKALTAVALIFAIFQHKPAPFCILDEVDAPLDDANVSRYNEAIRSMTDRSQFILITHIKTTMQAVDVLYGVTMGEPGVSRLVSVKVNQHARQRSESFAPPQSATTDPDSASQVA